MTTNSITQTREFMLAAGQACPDRPIQPYEDEHEAMFKLRLALCLEELGELAEAMGLKRTFAELQYTALKGYGAFKDTGTYDTVEVLDALADMRVVADGTVLACGLAEVFPAAMNEVHRSNMSKFPKSLQEAGDTVAAYFAQGVDVTCDMGRPAGTPMVVKRRSDGKILKSIDYLPANLKPLLNLQWEAHAPR